jgi:regulator-associated protein of mTOR
VFQRLFRQDQLVASLFRNFLLADRVLRSFNCTPTSIPRLASTAQHPLWQAWDLAAECCLSQLVRPSTPVITTQTHRHTQTACP